MPIVKPDLILQSECARRKKVTAQAVSNWIKTGKLRTYVDKGGRIKVDWNQAKHLEPMRPIAERPVFIDPEADAPTGGDVLDIHRAKLKRETYLAHAAELDFKKAAGELVSAADVAKAWDSVAANVRRRMMVLPDRLAPLLAAEINPRKVHNMLTEELHQALETLNRTPEELEEENAGAEPSESDENP